MTIIVRLFKLIWFLGFYAKEIVKTNCIVAVEVLTPTHYMSPGTVTIDVKGLSDLQLLVFCNLLTMTPGSIVTDINESKRTVQVHLLYLKDKAAAEKEIRESYLQRVIEVF